MSYLDFAHKINAMDVKVIFELGSRDLVDAVDLLDFFQGSKIYSFECNKDCLVECNKNLSMLDEDKRNRLVLVEKAVSIENGPCFSLKNRFLTWMKHPYYSFSPNQMDKM